VAEPLEGSLAAGPPSDSAEELRNFVDSLAARLEFPPAGRRKAEPAASEGAIKQETPELLGALRKIKQQLGSLRTAAGTALETFAPPPEGHEDGSNATYVEMKVQLLVSYIIYLVYYMLLKARGEAVDEHPVMPRLIWISTLLDKLRPVDQRVQYQISKLLQWAQAQAAPAGTQAVAGSPATEDIRALRPGDLALGVADEDGEGDEDVQGVTFADAEDDKVYRPPRVSQMDYTGDHMTMKEKAEKDLERKKNRLERSEFVRSLREEFTDAPAEIHGELKTMKAEKAARVAREQREYEEDNMTRLKVKKKERKARERVQSEGRMTGAGLSTLDDATMDFRDIERGMNAGGKGKGKGGKGRRGGNALQEFRDASSRVSHARGIVNQTLEGVMPGGGGGGGAKRRRTG